MPDVREGESRDSYMDRCMGDGKTVEKYGNPSQRAAVCNSMYDDKNSENAEAAEYQGKKLLLVSRSEHRAVKRNLPFM